MATPKGDGPLLVWGGDEQTTVRFECGDDVLVRRFDGQPIFVDTATRRKVTDGDNLSLETLVYRALRGRSVPNLPDGDRARMLASWCDEVGLDDAVVDFTVVIRPPQQLVVIVHEGDASPRVFESAVTLLDGQEYRGDREAELIALLLTKHYDGKRITISDDDAKLRYGDDVKRAYDDVHIAAPVEITASEVHEDAEVAHVYLG